MSLKHASLLLSKTSELAEFLIFFSFCKEVFFLKEVNAYLTATTLSSKTTAQSPGFSPALDV